MGLFQWNAKDRGTRIEGYLSILCTETPDVARALLKTDIKSVHQWLSNDAGNEVFVDEIEVAECGCLIGATLIALFRSNQDVVEPDGPFTNVPSTVIRGLMKVDGNFGGLNVDGISEVGYDVLAEVEDALYPRDRYEDEEEYQEAWNRREQAVVFFIKNQIRRNLGIPQLTKPE